MSVGLLVAGCVAAALVTWLARRYLPFPTYTAPFIVMTWALYFLGLAMGAAKVVPGGPLEEVGFVRRGRPRGQPGNVPGERLDRACSSSRESP